MPFNFLIIYYSIVQKFGLIQIILKEVLMLTKAAFIWSKIQEKQ